MRSARVPCGYCPSSVAPGKPCATCGKVTTRADGTPCPEGESPAKLGPADWVCVYVSRASAEENRDECRKSSHVAKVRIFKRTVRAGGAFAVVFAVCVWLTPSSKAQLSALS